MNSTLKTLTSIAVRLGVACLGGLTMGHLSRWVDSEFNQSWIYKSSFGFAATIPLFLGTMAGFVTGAVLLITDRKWQGLFSCGVGTLGLVIVGLRFHTVDQSPYGLTGAWILCGPSALWMVGLIFYGIWQYRTSVVLPGA